MLTTWVALHPSLLGVVALHWGISRSSVARPSRDSRISVIIISSYLECSFVGTTSTLVSALCNYRYGSCNPYYILSIFNPKPNDVLNTTKGRVKGQFPAGLFKCQKFFFCNPWNSPFVKINSVDHLTRIS